MKTIKGDLIEAFKNGEVDVIVHQANCQGVMGSGIAKQIKQEFPEHFEDYLEVVQKNKESLEELYEKRDRGEVFKTADLLGTVVVTSVEQGSIVAVLAQDYYGRGERHTNYAALFHGLTHVGTEALRSDLTVGIPAYIGCGLGGGDWGKVSEYVEDLEEVLGVEFVAYQLDF